MIVLGIDPGLQRLGYAFLDFSPNVCRPLSYGLVSTPSAWQKPKRIKQIYDDLTALILCHKPEAVALEKIIFSRNVTTALPVSEVRGVLILLAEQNGLPLIEFTPNEIKQSVTGYGRSDKNQIGSAVQFLLGLPEIPKPDDVCDALAVAICAGGAINYQKRIDLNLKNSIMSENRTE